MDKTKEFGLVLVGGGARTAYQIGVLKGIAEITGAKQAPFSIITGASAGAINGAAIASGAENFQATTERLWKLWENLRIGMVVRVDPISLGKIGGKLIFDLTLGGKFGIPASNHLLDTAPLRTLLDSEVHFPALRRNIESKRVRAFAVSATNYRSGTNVTFYETAHPIPDWIRSQHISRKSAITTDHLMASAAIPLFFPPVRLEEKFFGDGSVRLTTPLSPAIHLGAESLMVIGTRKKRTEETLREINSIPSEGVNLADIAGLIMNSIFLDSIEADIERLERINRTLESTPYPTGGAAPNPDRLKRIPALLISPSKDLGKLATERFESLPSMLKHLLQGVGATGKSGGELLSYLTFDSSYTRELLKIGHDDSIARSAEIEAFFRP